jgi:hypothetical protein
MAQLSLHCESSKTCERARFDLAQLASYYQSCVGTRPRLDNLLKIQISNPQFAPNPLHHMLARIARRQPMLIITTNYDDLLEKAFDSPADGGSPVPYELIVTPADDLAYPADSEDDLQVGPEYAGHLLHWKSGQDQTDFTHVRGFELSFDLTQRSVIYKIHGSVPRGNSWPGGYIIAEEDYARFLGQMDRKGIVPEPIMSLIGKKIKVGPNRAVPMYSLLFLGYSMRDWNLRVLLEQLRVGQRGVGLERHYAFMKAPHQIEREMLEQRRVKVFDCDLTRMVSKLSELT